MVSINDGKFQTLCPTAEKLKIVELCQPVNKNRCEMLEKLDQLLPVLQSEPIRQATALKPKLEPLLALQSQQAENVKWYRFWKN